MGRTETIRSQSVRSRVEVVGSAGHGCWAKASTNLCPWCPLMDLAVLLLLNMGCTSSAPNMPSPQHDTEKIQVNAEEIIKAEHEINLINKGVEEDDTKTNEFNAHLPTVDKSEDLMLARNNKSFLLATDLENDEVVNRHNFTKENSNNQFETNEDMLNDNLQVTGAKLETFEEVVEKVVELVENNNMEIKATTEINRANDTEIDIKEKVIDSAETDDEGQNQMEHSNQNSTEEIELQEVASPTQSQSSRATRWEALADIAAELPPSLTVDPITGQIYALSK